MKFATYGPFLYPKQNDQATVNLFQQIASAGKTLEFGVGVYVYVAASEAGIVKPWYVGKTSRSANHAFGARIFTHLQVDKFSDLMCSPRGISLYLIAAVDPNCQPRLADSLSATESEEIGQLESALIGAAFIQNPELLNKQSLGSKPYLPVPAYLDNCNTVSTARKLASVLNIAEV